MCDHTVTYRVILQADDEKYVPKDWIIEFNRGSRPYRAIKAKINSQGLNVCLGLDGEIGKDVKCSIHETKPQACRRYPVGSPMCLQARKKLSQVTK